MDKESTEPIDSDQPRYWIEKLNQL